jgi:integration host factor subunit alpha
MTLVKENLVQSLYDQVGLSKHQSKALVDNVFELIKKSLVSGEDVLISGFGKFSVKTKAPRRGRNPATGGDLNLGARRVVTFKCSPVFREKMGGDGSPKDDSGSKSGGTLSSE